MMEITIDEFRERLDEWMAEAAQMEPGGEELKVTGGDDAVVLMSLRAYENLTREFAEALEELDDVEALSRAIAEDDGTRYTHEEVMAMLEGDEDGDQAVRRGELHTGR